MSKKKDKMDKADFAEWLLHRVVDPDRASELVGDQLEAHPNAGQFRFWMSITQLFLIFSRRTILGIVVSPIAGSLIAVAFLILDTPQAPKWLGGSLTSLVNLWLCMFAVSILLWLATVFSLVRFGWRSTRTGIALMAAVLASTSTNFFRGEISVVVLIMLWAGFLVFCISSTTRRRALGSLSGAILAAWLTGFALAVSSHDPNSVFGRWQSLSALFLIPLVECGAMLSLGRKPESSSPVSF